jgi:protein SCO1/2
VLVTIDGARDTPERLRALAGERQLPLDRWTFLRGSDADVRELAMVLGVQYRRLANGNYAHSAMLTLLDPEGRISVQIEGLRRPKRPIVDRIRPFARRS